MLSFPNIVLWITLFYQRRHVTSTCMYMYMYMYTVHVTDLILKQYRLHGT